MVASNLQQGAVPSAPTDAQYPAPYWKSLRYFAVYRVIVACLMLAIAAAFSPRRRTLRHSAVQRFRP